MEPRERSCDQMSGREKKKPRGWFCAQSRDLPRQGANNPARTSKLNQDNENKSSWMVADMLPVAHVVLCAEAEKQTQTMAAYCSRHRHGVKGGPTKQDG